MIAKGTRVTGMKTARRWWNVDGMCPDGMKITGQRDFRSTIEQRHLGTQRVPEQASTRAPNNVNVNANDARHSQDR